MSETLKLPQWDGDYFIGASSGGDVLVLKLCDGTPFAVVPLTPVNEAAIVYLGYSGALMASGVTEAAVAREFEKLFVAAVNQGLNAGWLKTTAPQPAPTVVNVDTAPMAAAIEALPAAFADAVRDIVRQTRALGAKVLRDDIGRAVGSAYLYSEAE